MPGIYVAAIITTLVAVFVIGGLAIFVERGKRKRSKYFLWLTLISLPEFFIAFNFIRKPIDQYFQIIFNISESSVIPLQYSLISLFYAPITEELIKLFPLCIPYFRLKIIENNKIMAALAIGLGFGIGELWTIASWLSHEVSIAGLHWYQLYGYIVERLLACLMHCLFTFVALQGIYKLKKIIKYLLYAFGLHALANFSIFLYTSGIFFINKAKFQIFMFFYPIAYVIVLGFILLKNYRKNYLG